MKESNQRELTELLEVGEILDEQQADSVFLVFDRIAYEAADLAPKLAPILKNRRVQEFDQFIENPRLEHVYLGLQAFRSTDVDIIIAIGGGTAIDIAKLIRCFAGQSVTPAEIIDEPNRIDASLSSPLIAVPTTAGTGSEATHFAVVYVDGVKHSVAHESMLPDVSIVDPKLTYSMPSHLTAVSGLDALCQAIESMWSVNSTQDSYSHASAALDLLIANLHPAVHAPTSDIRAAMSRAANLAGKAINISKTTAPHAISYAITMSHGVPHGHAAALSLPSFLVFNYEVGLENLRDRRGVDHVRDVINGIIDQFGCQTAQQTAQKIRALVESIGCKTSLAALGIAHQRHLDLIAKSVNRARLSNNPREVTEKNIREILKSIR